MSRKTSFNDLYIAWCELVTAATGRVCFRKTGIQTQPNTAYATIYFEQGPSAVQDVLETAVLDTPLPTGETLSVTVWGTTRLNIKVEFFRNSDAHRAQDEALKFRNFLQLPERWGDIWQICGLVGPIDFIDVSGMFRSDIEGRAEIHLSIYANIATTTYLYDIQTQPINIDPAPGIGFSVIVDASKQKPDIAYKIDSYLDGELVPGIVSLVSIDESGHIVVNVNWPDTIQGGNL